MEITLLQWFLTEVFLLTFSCLSIVLRSLFFSYLQYKLLLILLSLQLYLNIFFLECHDALQLYLNI